MVYEAVKKEELVKDSRYTQEQQQGQLQQFAKATSIIKTEANNFDYFSKVQKAIRFPNEFPHLCSEKDFSAYTSYDKESGNYRIRIELNIAQEENIPHFLRKVNKMAALLNVNKLIEQEQSEETKDKAI